jgi:tRNA threonylcarbamoyladenosine biosynthesis protein TsaB
VIVLGFDTATPATAVALRLADGTTLRARDDPQPGARPGHTTRLLPLASELLAQAALRWSSLQRIAVGVGPGTFTGLRIGVATARALAQSLGVDVVAVGTPRVLAEAALREFEPAVSELRVLSVIDARRGEAFAAAYAPAEDPADAQAEDPADAQADDPADVQADDPADAQADDPADVQADDPADASADGPVGDSDDPRSPARAREIAPACALAPERFAALVAELGADRDWLAVGDGAVRFRAQLEAVGVAVAADSSALHRVDAGVLCELALVAPRGAPEAVLPDYRRRPDAEIALENAKQ